MKAYKRIKKLAETIISIAKEDSTVADVGADHGYLAELLNRESKISKIYATDISKKCLQKVIDLKNKFNLEKIETLLGDGLVPLESVDITVIAGIGGLEIIKMLTKQNKLTESKNKCNIFVLQPAQNVYEFRKWLFDNKIFVIKDFFVEDAGKFYPIIVIDVSKKQINEATLYNLFVGRDNDKKTPEFDKFLEFYIEKLSFLCKFKSNQIENDVILKEKYEIYKMLNELKNN